MKNPRTVWIVYTALRLLFFAVPFAALYLLGIRPWLAVIFAALIGFSLSILLLSKPRNAASASIYEWRNRDRTPDSIVEDEAADAAEAAAAEEHPTPAQVPAEQPAEEQAAPQAATPAADTEPGTDTVPPAAPTR